MSKINTDKEAFLSLETIKELLNYNPATGEFTWLRNRSSKAVAGQIAGSICKDGYRHIKINGMTYKAHRLAWFYCYGTWPEGEIDHRFRNRDDNREQSIRQASASENSINRGMRRDNSSGFKGVSWNRKSKKWSAEITANGNRMFLGFFMTPELAAEAYNKAAEQHHGKFVR
ncbi:TPA: HNH endonuclease [Serratia marcescens]|nr:HNH endonuclease [Serratia marcescens]